MESRILSLEVDRTGKGRTEVQIFNALGQQVFSSILHNDMNPITEKIDLGRAPGGIYYLKVMSGMKMYTETFVIEKVL